MLYSGTDKDAAHLLARLLHINSYNEPGRAHRPLEPVATSDIEHPNSPGNKFFLAPQIQLPSATPSPSRSIEKLLHSRRSAQSWGDKPMTFDDLGRLLAHGLGASNPRQANQSKSTSRTYPSAGAKYPLEAYLVIQRIEGLHSGLYHYEPYRHLLTVLDVGDGIVEQFMECIITPQQIEQSCVTITLTSVFDRTMSKYGLRGYRYILMEAGHVGQNVCLMAQALSLRSRCLGGFFDQLVIDYLQIDGRVEAPIYMIAIGTT